MSTANSAKQQARRDRMNGVKPSPPSRIRIRPYSTMLAVVFVVSMLIYAYVLPQRYDAGFSDGYTLGFADGTEEPAPEFGTPPTEYGIYRCTNAAGAVKWSLQEPYPANEQHNTSYYEPSLTLLIGEGAPWSCYLQAEGEVWR